MLNNKHMAIGAGVKKVYKQACFLVVSGPKNDPGRKHLHVCMNTAQAGEKALFLSVQTWKDDNRNYPMRYKHLYRSDHSFLDRESCIDYSRVEFYDAEMVLKAHQAGRNWIKRDAFTTRVFNQILVQFYESPYAKGIHKKMLQADYDLLKRAAPAPQV
jgi:hypothetical protein